MIESIESYLKQFRTFDPHKDLTLNTVKSTAKQLKLTEIDCSVITVGGTNGKGSTVKVLETLYRAGGYHTAVFTSPHITCYTELFRLNEQSVSKLQLLDAFKYIEQQTDISKLSEYEFLFLSGLYLFKQFNPDILLLEVGVGGRDDVTNILDPDIAVITNVSLDHCQLLGDTREQIGEVKAGIFRNDIPVIIGERNPPKPVLDKAAELNCDVYQLGDTFNIIKQESIWTWSSQKHTLEQMPIPNLILDNVAAALMTVSLLNPKLLNHAHVVLKDLSLAGRFEVIHGPRHIILDVAHNPASAQQLAKRLSEYAYHGKLLAVFSMFGDKDIDGSIEPLKNLINHWYVAPLNHPRGASISQIVETLIDQEKTVSGNITDSFKLALKKAKQNDIIIVFGSFQVIAAIKDQLV